jgi:hypothetical protein
MFEGYTLQQAIDFNEAQKRNMDDFYKIITEFKFNGDVWARFVETYAILRAYIWLGMGMRAYAERKVEEIGVPLELSVFYRSECACTLQAEMKEMDSEMEKEIHNLAEKLQQIILPAEIASLKEENIEMYHEFIKLTEKFRFENNVALEKPVDMQIVYKKVMQVVDNIKLGGGFVTNKHLNKNRNVLPDLKELKEWLRLSIWNRVMQSDSHHLEGMAKALLHPKLIELGNQLVSKGLLPTATAVFQLKESEITQHLTTLYSDVISGNSIQ